MSHPIAGEDTLATGPRYDRIVARPQNRVATYEDVLAAPENKVAEIVDGELHLSPRPAGPHTASASALGEELAGPFKRGRGGPGGWLIVFEPEIHLGRDILVPDLAGWRRERLPVLPNAPFVELAPDWLCEVLSPSTEKLDRAGKLPIYARAEVSHVWLVNPLLRTLEVLRRQDRSWLTVAVRRDEDKVRAEPFEAFELDLAILWADFAP
jgi:Uma2 family endonuclease